MKELFTKRSMHIENRDHFHFMMTFTILKHILISNNIYACIQREFCDYCHFQHNNISIDSHTDVLNLKTFKDFC